MSDDEAAKEARSVASMAPYRGGLPSDDEAAKEARRVASMAPFEFKRAVIARHREAMAKLYAARKAAHEELQSRRAAAHEPPKSP
jgi:hypothetical protein